MYKNNFDKSSTGTDIEVYCAYDWDVACMDFKENFKILQHESYHKTCKAFYTGQELDPDSITFTIKGTVKEMRRFAKAECYWLESREVNKLNKAGLIDEINELLARSEVICVLNYQELNEEFFSPTHYFGKEEPESYDLELVPDRTLLWVSVSGSSQGEYAEVCYAPDSVYPKYDESGMKQYFERLFYDAPIYARFDIDGEEYYYHEYVDDTYEWEPEAFAEGVAKDSGIDVETLKGFLPEYPDYQ